MFSAHPNNTPYTLTYTAMVRVTGFEEKPTGAGLPVPHRGSQIVHVHYLFHYSQRRAAANPKPAHQAPSAGRGRFSRDQLHQSATVQIENSRSSRRCGPKRCGDPM